MRLWLRLTLWMAALTVVPTVLTGVVAVRATTEAAALRPEEALLREASTLSTFVGVWLRGQRDRLEGWARPWSVDDRDEAHRVGLLRAVYQGFDDVVVAALVDGQGQPVVPSQFLTAEQLGAEAERASGRRRAPGSADRARALEQRAGGLLQRGRTGLGEPYRPPGSTRPSLPVVVPVGALFLAVELSLDPLDRAFPGGSEHVAALLDADRLPVFGGGHPLVDADVDDAVLELGVDATFGPVEVAGQSLRGATSAVPGTGWTVLVVEPAGVGSLAARRIRLQTGGVVLLSLTVVAGAGWVIERSLTRYVGELRAHALAVADGELGRRLTVDREDELGELARSLDLMSVRLAANAAQIAEQKAEIEGWAEELQARVDARTAELEAAQAELVRVGRVEAVAEVGAGLAHELNNPLAAILGTIQLLRARHDEPALARVEEAALRAREVVGRMQALSAPPVEADGADVVDLDEVVAEVLAVVRPSFRRRGVRLRPVGLTSGVRARVGRRTLTSLLTDILQALRAGLREGAVVEVGTTRRLGEAVVHLRLEGASVEDDDWRAQGFRRWSARRLVERAGGRVETDDAAPGAWSLVLPAGSGGAA